MIAGTDEQRRIAGTPGEVLFDHHDLGFEVERIGQVEQVPADQHGVETTGDGCQPVELLQGVGKVGDK